MVSAKNENALALANAVQAAVEKLGPLATASLLAVHIDLVRQIKASGDYPRMLYGARGSVRTVESKAEEEELGKYWSRTPGDEHRGGHSGAVTGNDEAVTAQIAVRKMSGMPGIGQRDAGLEVLISGATTVSRINT